jgi:hypothetical protein
MYYQFLTSPLAQYGITDYPRVEGVSFTVGTPIRQDLAEPLRFPADTTAENPPPDFTEMVIPVMSDRLLSALREAGVDNLQSFEARLENPDTGEVWTGYHAVNIIGTIECADLDQSEYAELGGGLLSFSWLVVDPKRAKGALFFRLAEAPDMIIAHRKVGDYLFDPKRPKWSGFRFWPASAEDVAKLRKEAQ